MTGLAGARRRFTPRLRRRRAASPFEEGNGARIVFRRYPIHLPALAYITITVFLALGAINAQNNLLFLIFGIAMATLIVSGFLSGAMMMSIRLRRAVLDQPRVGEPFRIRYEVHNTHRVFPIFAVTIRERTGRGVARASWRTGVPQVTAFLAHAPPRGTTMCEAQPTPTHRGAFTLDRLDAETSFPFGIIRKAVRFSQPDQFLVHPRIVHLDPARIPDLIRRGVDDPPPHQRSGQGLEFYGVREYRQGDPARLIAWRASARTGQLITRQHADESSRSLTLRLDLTPAQSIGDERRRDESVERAISLCASLLAYASRMGTPVGLNVPTHAISFAPTSAGGRYLSRMLDALAMIGPLETALAHPASPPARANLTISASPTPLHDPRTSPATLSGWDLEAFTTTA